MKTAGIYLASMAVMVLPWVVFLPGALAIPFMKRFRPDRDALTFLLCWTVGLFLLLSAATRKRVHYILPALPAVCLLMGYCAEQVFFKRVWLTRRTAERIVVGLAGAGILAIVAALVAVTLAPASTRPLWLHVLIVADVVAVPLSVALLAFWQDRVRAVVGALVAAATLGFVGFSTAADLWDDGAEVARVARQAAAVIPPSGRVALWYKPDAALIFYFGRDVPDAHQVRGRLSRLHGQQHAQRLREDRFPRWIFGRRKDAVELARLGFVPVRHVGVVQASGQDWALFRLRDGGPELTERKPATGKESYMANGRRSGVQ